MAELNLASMSDSGTRDPRLAAEEVLELARTMVRSGSRHDAVETLDHHLRSGLWRWTRLWKELVSLMDEPADYGRLRALWLAAPRRTHRSLSIQRSVARAASAGREHGEARALLRKAIIAQARRRRRRRARLGRARRRVLSALPARSSSPPNARDQAFDLRAAVALAALSWELDRVGVKPFLISGTLLGYLREGNFISWDKDIDVGIFTSEIKTNDVELAFDNSAEFTVRRLDFNAERLRVDHINGIKVDIFPHYGAFDGKVWHDGTATRWWNSPFELKEIEFLNERQYVPSDPERYLDENYGNWRVPEPNFDARIDAPNVEITDQDYFDTLLYFSLLDAVVKGNPVKRERYRAMLRELGEGEWLNEV